LQTLILISLEVPFLLVGLLFGLQFALRDNAARSASAQPVRYAPVEQIKPIAQCQIGYVPTEKLHVGIDVVL
jgi:hypothetical protein